MSEKLISIIMPIYNAESFMERSITSILSQTYHNIEIILVDDGSTDRSGTICDSYALEDNRIIVIHQLNGGVSSARQTGLNIAKGDYVIHVDPDDWIEPDEIKELYETAIETKADLLICDYWEETHKGSHYVSQDPKDTSPYNIILKMAHQELFGCSWNKFIRRSCLQKYGIKYEPTFISYCEDLLFNSRLLKKEVKVVYLPKAFYHYYMDNSSNLTHSFSKKKLESRIYVNRELEKLIDKSDIDYLIPQKKDVLFEAFMLKDFSLLKSIYPEVRHMIIENNKEFYIYTPISSCLSLALKGHPHIAYYLCKVLLFIFNLKNRIFKK